MTYNLIGIDVNPIQPDKFEVVTFTPVIIGSESEIKETNWIIYPYKNHDKGGSWGTVNGTIIGITFELDIYDAS